MLDLSQRIASMYVLPGRCVSFAFDAVWWWQPTTFPNIIVLALWLRPSCLDAVLRLRLDLCAESGSRSASSSLALMTCSVWLGAVSRSFSKLCLDGSQRPSLGNHGCVSLCDRTVCCVCACCHALPAAHHRNALPQPMAVKSLPAFKLRRAAEPTNDTILYVVYAFGAVRCRLRTPG